MLRLPVGVTWIELEFRDGGRPEARRAEEHRAGRAAAAAGLAALGCTATGITAAPSGHGAPRFPSGFAGSITHDHGHAAALVAAPTSGYTTVGADLHVIRSMDETTAAYISTPAERAAARSVIGVDADQVLFALKEAVFKALCGSGTTWFEFEDMELEIEQHGAARLRRPHPTGTEMRWARTGDIIRAAALVRAAA